MVRATELLLALAVSVTASCGIDWTVPKRAPAADGGADGGGAGSGGGASPDKGASAVTSGGAPSCDASGDCFGCVMCAQKPCQTVIEACLMIDECQSALKCVQGCDPKSAQACLDMCTTKSPDGMKAFEAVVQCAVCQHCPLDCAEVVKQSCS